ncbi:hypothetical protein ADK76_31075 [Streptomyces griseoflavus]|uniref:hypothetical protein n=1 Tax=Streptomyces TaxID=1883 RepID=UPI0004C95C2C|nr:MULTISPECIES: hypothetical protein [Streptomyces]KOG52734.1 hypothetical protein ADK76_31075 [Streptomyces griseoflavus]KOT88147.1 hypothetical protein ADK86_33450 [Streptomyces sp. NRRL F-5755]KWT59711.1 hypothetical protein ADL21_22840 [Streptomyces albus subsp. albus]
MSYALAAAVALSGMLFTGATAEAAATARTQAQPSGPPFPYADCVKVVKKQYKGKKDPKATCDALVRKGYIKKPGT